MKQKTSASLKTSTCGGSARSVDATPPRQLQARATCNLRWRLGWKGTPANGAADIPKNDRAT